MRYVLHNPTPQNTENTKLSRCVADNTVPVTDLPHLLRHPSLPPHPTEPAGRDSIALELARGGYGSEDEDGIAFDHDRPSTGQEFRRNIDGWTDKA